MQTSIEKLDHLKKIQSYIVKTYGKKYEKRYLSKFFKLEGVKNAPQKAYQYKNNSKIDPFIEKRINVLLSVINA